MNLSGKDRPLLVTSHRGCSFDEGRSNEIPVWVFRNMEATAIKVNRPTFLICGGDQTRHSGFRRGRDQWSPSK